MKRRAVRELALKILFAKELGNTDYNITKKQLYSDEEIDTLGQKFCNNLIEGVIENQDKIDALIKKYSIEWDIDRIAGVDKNIMRLAIYEIIYEPNIPEAVAANEAVELAKTYSTEEASRFINGILGKIIKAEKDIKGE